ncbi:hypothetical protein L1D14_25580 [Vibrio tubiashii]|uniref:hypothetical protein n=1 Tax=Vibrio tubiashii TaxID=29498 RepID=UPI001EFDCB4D|nr:hypothetical protein [Vibrio tubiashii]MCG9579583.1 hypothetical protein [Vibrio tubiashii]
MNIRKLALLSASLTFASFSIASEKDDNVGSGAYRLALLVDNGTVTLFNIMIVVGFICAIGAILLYVNSSKTQMPKSVPAWLMMIAFILCSPRACMQMNARTFLNNGDVQAVEVKRSSDIIMNGE